MVCRDVVKIMGSILKLFYFKAHCTLFYYRAWKTVFSSVQFEITIIANSNSDRDVEIA
jgi:hypothetical protein